MTIEFYNKNMKHTIILILVLIPLSISGQNITFSSEILNTKDPQIEAVRDLWKSYVSTCKNVDKKPSLEYWNKSEIDQGFTDIILRVISTPYLFGNLIVSDIKKVDNDYYKIHNIWFLGDSTYMFKFNVYAKKEVNSYKLFNSFFVIKPKLLLFQTDNFDYYYPRNFSFNIQKAKQSAEFYSKISSLYGNTDKRKIIYLVGTSLDEANSIIGFDHSLISSSNPFAGTTINCQNFMILSGREDHFHEIVHSVLIPMFPNSHMLFQEGIATYYGGNANRKLSDFILELKKLIKDKPEIDLSKFDDIDKILNDGKFNNFYFLGAIFIDYALKIGGPKKVLALLRYPINDQYSFEDTKSAIQQELGIEKSQIDNFIKKYVQDYTLN
jgi:hypothetical protein